MTVPAKRLPQVDDYYLMKHVSTPDYCAAANLLVYVTSIAEAQRNVRQVTVRDLATGKETRITAGGDIEDSPRISPNGRFVAFCSNVTGDPQVWMADLDDGSVRRMTSLRYGAAGPVWSPQGDRLALLAPMWSADGEDARHTLRDPNAVAAAERKRESEPVAIEDYGFKSDANAGFTQDVPPNHVWVMGLHDDRPVCLTDQDKMHVMPVWSPDGEAIVLASNRERSPEEFLGLDLYTVPSAGGPLVRITKDVFVAFYPKKIVPRYTPDGQHVIFGGLTVDADGISPCFLYRVPAAGGELVQLFGEGTVCDNAWRFLYNPNTFGDAYETMQVSEDGRDVYFISGRHGTGNVYRVPVDGQSEVTAVTSGRENYASLTEPYNGKVIVTKTDALQLDDIYELDLSSGGTRRLTHHNDWLDEIAISDMDELWIETLDGNTRVQGWVIKPQQAQDGEKYPAVLYIHGGPQPYYGYALTYEFQCLAAQGIGVIMVNPRGSTGYGREHAKTAHAFDGTAYYDLLQFVDEAVRTFSWIDGDRLGVCGGSYGGYMTNWMAAHSSRFKAAASHRSVTNYLISYASSDMGANGRSRQFASYEEFMLQELERSPVAYADKINSPFLILHGTKDMRCPVEGAHQLYTAIKDYHPELPVRMVLFPHSNHSLPMSGPMYLRQRHFQENINWFKQYL